MKVTIEDIVNSFTDGKKKQMIGQIKEFGEYEFFTEFFGFCNEYCDNPSMVAHTYAGLVIYYHTPLTNKMGL